MYIYIYIYIYICMYIYIYMYIYLHTCIDIHTCMQICLRIYIYIDISTQTHAYIHSHTRKYLSTGAPLTLNTDSVSVFETAGVTVLSTYLQKNRKLIKMKTNTYIQQRLSISETLQFCERLCNDLFHEPVSKKGQMAREGESIGGG